MSLKLFIRFLCEYIFWLIFFLICRSIFLFYNWNELKGIPFTEVISVYWHALYLDTSIAFYFLVLSFICFSFLGSFNRKIFLVINRVYVVIILFLFSIITIAELEIYDEWGTKLNLKAIRFLRQPSEVIHSANTTFLVFGFFAAGILALIGFYLHKKIENFSIPIQSVGTNFGKVNAKRIIGTSVFVVVIPVLLFLGIRGGFQQIPIQQSNVYFSKHNILNLAAVNPAWNLGQSIWENRKSMEGNPYIFFPPKDAQENMVEMYAEEKDSTILFLKTNRPNIIFVILESWSADMLDSFAGCGIVTPGFRQLAAEGILLDSMYASGDLSDEGMLALFSGFPALPLGISLIVQPDKFKDLPCIGKEFQKAGYKTSFLYGGQLSYGNIKAYMYYNRFDKILEGKDFDANIPRGKLGVHDEFLYTRQLSELRNEKEPFFVAMFTLSSHSPYDFPMKKKFFCGDDETNYVNGIFYADSALFDFVQKAKKEKWFDNTLFIITADHSHRSPLHWVQQQPEYRRIPMLFYGNVIKEEFRGSRCEKVCSQIDLAAALLKQTDLPSERFKWSKNIFNPCTKEFAFYTTLDGFGFVQRGQYLVYSHPDKSFPFEKTISPVEKAKMEKEGKSFLQMMFQQYTDF